MWSEFRITESSLIFIFKNTVITAGTVHPRQYAICSSNFNLAEYSISIISISVSLLKYVSKILGFF